MSDTPWTKGPWSVCLYDCGDEPHRDHNGPCPSIQAPDDQDCAIVHWDGFKQKYWSSANGNQKQIEANARLISCAPEMAEALGELLAHFGPEANSDGWYSDPVHSDEVNIGRALLARIHGDKQ